MELEKEFIEKHTLSPEAVTAIQGVYDTHIVDLKGGWDKKASDGAQDIINNVTTKTQEATGFALERNKDELNAPFLLRYTTAYLGSKLDSEKLAMEKSKADYDLKLNDFKGDESLKSDHDELKIKYSDLQKKEADFDALTTEGYKDKYDTLFTESETMREDIAFGGAKPLFSKDANSYESDAIWGKFIRDTKETHNVVVVDGEGIAIDKTNEHKRIPLKDLVKGNDELTRLINGRQQKGLKVDQVDLKDVVGLAFRVPKDADRAKIAKLVQEQLTIDGVGQTDPKYSDKYQAMYDLAKTGKQPA